MQLCGPLMAFSSWGMNEQMAGGSTLRRFLVLVPSFLFFPLAKRQREQDKFEHINQPIADKPAAISNMTTPRQNKAQAGFATI